MGDFGGDPGYAISGDTGPYSVSKGPSSMAGGPSGLGSSLSPPGSSMDPRLSQPSWTTPSYDPSSGIPDWTRNPGPNVSLDDSIRIQQLYQERHDLQTQLSQSPGADLAQMGLDLLGAVGGAKGPDSIPLGEERLQQGARINQINGELQGLFDRNNILASPYAEERAPSTAPNANSSGGGNYSVHISDSAPNGSVPTPPAAAAPINWMSPIQDSLSPLGYETMAGPAPGAVGPADPGGIDFRSVRWVYMSEGDSQKPGAWNTRTFACGIQAIRSNGEMKVRFPLASRLVSDAFLVFLTIPDRDLWVNLHPAEPRRIIPASLGQTDVGRIMLEADFQLKRDAGALMKTQPFAGAERALVDSIVSRHRRSHDVLRRWGSTGRVEISSATSKVFARESGGGIFIQGAVLDVVFEQKKFSVLAGPSNESLEISPQEWEEFVRLTEKWIRPRLIGRVNRAPEYENLRQVFSARILSDWYKRKRRSKGSLAPQVDRVRLQGLTSPRHSSPETFWRTFKKDYDSGATRGYGGVSLERMPAFAPMPGTSRLGEVLFAEALASPRGSWRHGVYRMGRVLTVTGKPSSLTWVARWTIACVLIGLLVVTALYRPEFGDRFCGNGSSSSDRSV